MKILFYSLQLFLTTLAFLSWIPIPKWGYTNKALHRMGIFFPIVGAILGGIAALILVCSSLFFPYTVSVAITLMMYGWITGAFHEDALADVADGMGGDDTKKILTIMRDSCIGTYGSFALISSYVLRFAALSAVSPQMVVCNLIAYAAVSRSAGVFFLTLTQTKDIPPESLSHSVSFSNQWLSCVINISLTVLVVYLVLPSNTFLIPFVYVMVPVLARQYFLHRMECITGDCAGFVIHVTETVLHVLATMR